jgi:hypothetical protein
MKKIYFLLLITFGLQIDSLQAQNYFKYHSFGIEEAWTIEKSMGGVENLNPTHVIQTNLKSEQPIPFNRPKTGTIEPASIHYFYTKEDTKVKMVSFSWPTIQQESKEVFFATYTPQLDAIVAEVSKELGTPQTDPTPFSKMKKEPFKGCYEKYYRWNNEYCTVFVSLVWSKDKRYESLSTSIHYKN